MGCHGDQLAARAKRACNNKEQEDYGGRHSEDGQHHVHQGFAHGSSTNEVCRGDGQHEYRGDKYFEYSFSEYSKRDSQGADHSHWTILTIFPHGADVRHRAEGRRIPHSAENSQFSCRSICVVHRIFSHGAEQSHRTVGTGSFQLSIHLCCTLYIFRFVGRHYRRTPFPLQSPTIAFEKINYGRWIIAGRLLVFLP